jgi:hypothetical protein
MRKRDRGIIERSLRHHLIMYGFASVVFFVADSFMPGALWFHWPVMTWGAIAGAHLLYCKSVNVDEAWAERRALDLRLKSYDLGHILDID